MDGPPSPYPAPYHMDSGSSGSTPSPTAAPVGRRRSDVGREVGRCGDCRWHVKGGALVKSGECEDCQFLDFWGLGHGDETIVSIADAFSGLPRLIFLSLRSIGHRNAHIWNLSAFNFYDLPMLQRLDIVGLPLLGIDPGTFANNTALQYVTLWETGLGCIPAVGIPETVDFQVTKVADHSNTRLPRCPADCRSGTVYNTFSGLCVACPAGQQPAGGVGTAGGDGLKMCVPAGWDATWLTSCGSCAFWLATQTNMLKRTGSCAEDCTGQLNLYGSNIMSFADNVLSGLPFVTYLYLNGNQLKSIPEDLLWGLSGLQQLSIGRQPLIGFAPATFAKNTVLEVLNVEDSAISSRSCVPASIEAASYEYTAGSVLISRCPADCGAGTIYNPSDGTCVACPAGLQPAGGSDTVGADARLCVPAGWDVVWLRSCGSCVFWRAATTNVLHRTGSCADDCNGLDTVGDGSGYTALDLAAKGIAAVAPGTFDKLFFPGIGGRVSGIYLVGNPLGCAPITESTTGLDCGTGPITPKCPANCTLGTYFVTPANVWEDCRQDTSFGYSGSVCGVCLPCPRGMTTAGVGGSGVESCFDPDVAPQPPLIGIVPLPSINETDAFAALLEPTSVPRCAETRAWKELRELERLDWMRTGALGHLMIDDEMEVWMCVPKGECLGDIYNLVINVASPDHYELPEWVVTYKEHLHHALVGGASLSAALSADSMCYVYHERLHRFLPWAPNSILKLYPIPSPVPGNWG